MFGDSMNLIDNRNHRGFPWQATATAIGGCGFAADENGTVGITHEETKHLFIEFMAPEDKPEKN